MSRWKRLFYYLVLNILVSACTTLAVLIAWERTHPSFLGSLAALSPVSSPSPVLVSSIQEELSPTPEPVPTRALITYRVEPGDTLGHLAEKFDVSVQELMDINQMADANSLGSGQVLFVPAPLPTEMPELQPSQLPLQEPPPGGEGIGTPAAAAAPDSRATIANAFGVGDLPTERVRIERRGEGDLLMAGWKLVDRNGLEFVFPNLTLFKGGAIDVYTRTGVNSVIALYWGLDKPVWEQGETVTLYDQSGAVHSVYVIP